MSGRPAEAVACSPPHGPCRAPAQLSGPCHGRARRPACTARARTPGQAPVVVVGHMLLLGAGDGVMVLQQRDGGLQRVRAGRGRAPGSVQGVGARFGRRRQQLQLARGLQEGGALAY